MKRFFTAALLVVLLATGTPGVGFAAPGDGEDIGRLRPDEAQDLLRGGDPSATPSTLTLQTATIHNLGFGASSAERINKMIYAIRSRSPMNGYGAHIVNQARIWDVDPLLIAQWAYESEMALTGVNSPNNGGNLTWEAAKPYAAKYGCTAGAYADGHRFAWCPSMSAGISIWFNYVGVRYKDFKNLEDYVNTYNPCWDPGNIENGYLCGTKYGEAIMDLVRRYSGPSAGTYAAQPSVSLVAGSQASQTSSGVVVPVRVGWSGGGVSRYELQQSRDYGSYYTVTLPTATATSIVRRLSPYSNYRFRVRARDSAGNWSLWTYGTRFTVSDYHASHANLSYSGSWTVQKLTAAWGGGVRYTRAAVARARLTFTGRSIAWVSHKGPTRGKATVYVDGAYVATVDLYSGTLTARRLAFTRTWSATGSHTIEIRAAGTSGRPRVDVDQFAVLR